MGGRELSEKVDIERPHPLDKVWFFLFDQIGRFESLRIVVFIQG